MFDPRKDRLSYADALQPPKGCALEWAIGTTYSLDLETLTAVSLSLGLSAQTDSQILSNPICMLKALQSVSGRMLLFCEAGQTKLPSSTSPLFLLLEQMVVPVALGHGTGPAHPPAFHAKVWLLGYKSTDGEKTRRTRAMVLSRNLTYDRSWDVSAVLDGRPAAPGEDTGKSRPLTAFLRFLEDQIPPGLDPEGAKGELLKKARAAVGNTVFTLEPRDAGPFTDFSFLPMGIGTGGWSPDTDAQWQAPCEHLAVMSPFLSEEVVSSLFRSCRGEGYLYTRKRELSKVRETAEDPENQLKVCVLADVIYDGETGLSEYGEDPEEDTSTEEPAPSEESDSLPEDLPFLDAHQDIHAKVYLREYRDHTDLCLGSMNATHAALHRNVEFMLLLRGQGEELQAETFHREIRISEEEPAFEQVESWDSEDPDPDADLLDVLEGDIKSLCRAGGLARVCPQGDQLYEVQVTFPPNKVLPDSLELAPLQDGRYVPVSETLLFAPLEEWQLSAFYRVRSTGTSPQTGERRSVQRVILIPTSGLPEGRDRAVWNSVVHSKGDFLEYLSYVLEEDALSAALAGGERHAAGPSHRWASRLQPAIYESLLKAAGSEEKLEEIRQVLQAVEDESVVPEGFRSLFDTVQAAAKEWKQQDDEDQEREGRTGYGTEGPGGLE